MDGGVGGLAQEGGGGAHHRAGGERGGDESTHWSLHYLDVAAPDPPLVPTERRQSGRGYGASLHLLGVQAADGYGGDEGRHSDEDSDDEDENLNPVNPGSSSDLRTSLHIVDGVLREDSLQFPVSLVIKQLVDNI